MGLDTSGAWFEETMASEAANSTSPAGRLVEFCLRSACRDKHSVAIWRRQRRTLARLPSQLAEPLFHRLLHSHLLTPPLLELFQHSIEEADLSGELSVDAEWMAYMGGFHHLRILRATDCRSLTNNALWHLVGLTSIEELELTRCKKLSDEGVCHIVSLTQLKKLGLAETGVGTKGLAMLPVLTALNYLDLGGCPVTDAHLSSLQALEQLVHIDLWGSKVSNAGAVHLKSFKSLQMLNLALTSVTVIPPLRSLICLNLSNCRIESIFKGWEESEIPLKELYLSGAVLLSRDAIVSIGTTRVTLLNLSDSNSTGVDGLLLMQELSMLDLTSTRFFNDSVMHRFAGFGGNLRWLSLSRTNVGSKGVGALVGHVRQLEQLSLSYTSVDDHVFALLALMPSLQSVNLSSTKVEGTLEVGAGKQTSVLSHLHQLPSLKRLDLRDTGIQDGSCMELAALKQITHLYLRSDFLSDACLQALSSCPSLLCLGIQGAVVSDTGLQEFSPPCLLQELDLSDCWLLSEDAVLNFCEAYPSIMLWNERNLVNISKLPKIQTPSKEFADVVSGEKATSFTREMQKARIQSRKGSSGPLKKELPKARKTTSTSGTAGGSSRSAIVLDERLRYTMKELYHLQHEPASSLSISEMGIESMLEIFARDSVPQIP